MSTNTKPQPLDQVKTYLHEHGLLIPLICVVASLLVGTILGLALGSHDSQTTPKAVSTAVKTAAPVVETTEVTPQACLDALDEADRGFNLASDTASTYQDAIKAIEAGDLDGVSSATSDLKSINTSLNNLTPDYTADKAACRASAN